jgi:hypothetical protein
MVGQLLLVVVGGFLAYRQLKTAIETRRLQTALSIFQRLEDSEFRNARMLVHRHMDRVNAILRFPLAECRDGMDSEILKLSGGKMDIATIDRVVHTLENLSFLIVTDDPLYNLLVPNMLANMFTTDYKHLAEFIKYRQHPDNRAGRARNPSSYGHHLVTLAEEIRLTNGAARTLANRSKRKMQIISRSSHFQNIVAALDQMSDFTERCAIVEEIEQLKRDMRTIQQRIGQ